MAQPAPIDRSSYMVSPRSTVSRTLTLSRLLLQYTPAQPSPDLASMTWRLREQVEVAAASVRARHLEHGPSSAAAEQAVDTHVDALERMRSERLGHWQQLDNPAVRQLAEQQKRQGIQPGEFDYDAALDHAREATRLQSLLYPNGLEYTRRSYLEQAESIQTITAIIDEHDCRAALDTLVGPELGAAIDDGYRQYGRMLETRTLRARGSEVDLREVNLGLQRAIQNYTIALLAMIRDEDPDNVAMIRRALRPIDAVREQNLIERGRSSSAIVEAVDAEAIDELLAAQRAVDAELGITDDATTEDPSVAVPDGAA